VSRREFYRAIWMAMVPALAWGAVLFGVRVLAMTVAGVAAATAAHLVLKRWLPRVRQADGGRGGVLVYGHCLVSALVLVALARPTWPVWAVAAAAGLAPVLLMAVGGAGRERVHVAVALAVGLQFLVLPLVARQGVYAGGGDAILARDRLLMGDIREQRAAAPDPWPRSRELRGDDAARVRLPARTAADVLDGLSARLLTGEAVSGGFTKEEAAAWRRALDDAFSFGLPGIGMQVGGATPGRVGVVSAVAIAAGGLYLAYRYILRPRSAVLFGAAFVGGTAAFAFWPAAAAHVGPVGMWNVVKAFPAEVGTLVMYLLLNSDAAFATVIVLALPGTEPLTARGRRVFLVAAGVLGAGLHRLHPEVPAATLALCALMPAAGQFDRFFGQRSWLNARR
jgi:hypothetical protein